jgi:DNA modification methylase
MMKLRPIIVDAEGMILGGNMRFKALQELKYKDIPDEWVKRDGELTDEEKQRFIVADNIGFGEYDWDMLANEWDKDKLIEWGLEIPNFAFKQDVVEDDYEIPDEIKTDIVIGDLFEIGQHRLLCGDSTNADDVAKLINGGKPNLMVTDPPYGVEYDPEWRKRLKINKSNLKMGKVTNDNNADWRKAYQLFNGNIAYVWHAGKHASIVEQGLIECGFEIRNQIIWAKDKAALSRGDYHWRHEPCWYAVRIKGNWCGDRSQNTVWNINTREDSGSGHGTQKPVECMARPIKNNTYEMESVYDPFLGSGTTMVAAHQLRRMCYAMELEPKYCQCTIDRMKKLDPDIVIKKNGVICDK